MSDSDVGLNRQILSSFLPNQQAIRAFEKIITVVGVDFPDAQALLDVLTQTSASSSETRATSNRLRQEVEELRLEVAALRKQRETIFDQMKLIPDRKPIQAQPQELIPQRIPITQQQELTPQRIPNLNSLERRITDLETLIGTGG
jgi:hypothetical protein